MSTKVRRRTARRWGLGQLMTVRELPATVFVALGLLLAGSARSASKRERPRFWGSSSDPQVEIWSGHLGCFLCGFIDYATGKFVVNRCERQGRLPGRTLTRATVRELSELSSLFCEQVRFRAYERGWTIEPVLQKPCPQTLRSVNLRMKPSP